LFCFLDCAFLSNVEEEINKMHQINSFTNLLLFCLLLHVSARTQSHHQGV
jgi:hypothetical protein